MSVKDGSADPGPKCCVWIHCAWSAQPSYRELEGEAATYPHLQQTAPSTSIIPAPTLPPHSARHSDPPPISYLHPTVDPSASLEIQEEDLEELLIYDDIFMEYFNEFLSLPAFPVRLIYNRLTGNVQELDGVRHSPPADYGANDLQRDRTLTWLRRERLPLFRRSLLYLEYKLARLLLRPLEDPRSVSRYGLHGYSRQSNNVTLSSIPSHSSSSYPPVGGSTLMPSRVQSAPAANGYTSETYNLSLLKQYGDAISQLYGPLDLDFQEDLLLLSPGEEIGLNMEEPDGRTTPILPFFDDIPAVSGAFMNGKEGNAAFSSQMNEGFVTTEEEERFLLQHNLSWSSLQQLKVMALGTREGMRRFRDFLGNTLGIHLFHFWIECEEFKEFSVNVDSHQTPQESRDLCVHLFRSIQSKYQTSLSAECQEQIRLSQQNWGPTSHALRRSQYDALRRLRSYWVPRFIIHQQSAQRACQKAGRRTSLASADSVSDGEWLDYGQEGSGGESERKRQNLSERWSPSPGVPTRGWDLMEKVRGGPLLQKMLPALRSDLEAGGAFLHYLKRFESPQKSQALLMWKELHEFSDWESHGDGWACQLHVESVSRPSGDERLSDLGSASQMALAALCQPWIGFLQYDIAMFLEYCVPAVYRESQDHNVCRNSRNEKGQKRNKTEKVFGFSLPEGKANLKKKRERFVLPSEGLPGGPRPDPEVPLEMLQHRAIYKVYRRAVQDTEEPELLKALELLHALRDAKGDRKLLSLVQKTLELNVFQKPFLTGLRKCLVNELSKGTISRSSLEETRRFLASLLAESFDRFWSEVTGRLKDYGVEETGNDGWVRLEPILKVISTKIILKRLHGRKNNASLSVKTQPSAEDTASFNKASVAASQGWPTPEVLHFLRHLQTYGPQEGLPLLQNNLLCYLEVEKYRNFHHPMPDRGFLKRKVKVIKERFLWPSSYPELQLSPEILQKSLQDAETAEHSEVPSSSAFSQLQDALRDSLLPFWAGFQKTWRILSPNRMQQLPLLPVQQMLRKRLALFEMEESSVKTFNLPPIPSRFPSTVTFNFSISHGVTLQENTGQGRDSQDDCRASHDGGLPPLTKTSANTTHAEGTKMDR